jgi:hypothetical protein
MPDSALDRLHPYEPRRARPGLAGHAGPLTLDLPPQPGKPAGDQDGPRLELRQVRAVLNLILEVRAGYRPPARLRALVHPRLYRLLCEEPEGANMRYTLKTVHACRVAPKAVEACGTAHRQGHAYAVVARFERAPQGWRCTFFDLIRPGPG